MNINIINVIKEKFMGFERGGFFEYVLNIWIIFYIKYIGNE